MEFMQDFWHIKILHTWSKFIGGFSILVASMFLVKLITDRGDHAPLGATWRWFQTIRWIVWHWEHYGIRHKTKGHWEFKVFGVIKVLENCRWHILVEVLGYFVNSTHGALRQIQLNECTLRWTISGTCDVHNFLS